MACVSKNQRGYIVYLALLVLFSIVTLRAFLNVVPIKPKRSLPVIDKPAYDESFYKRLLKMTPSFFDQSASQSKADQPLPPENTAHIHLTSSDVYPPVNGTSPTIDILKLFPEKQSANQSNADLLLPPENTPSIRLTSSDVYPVNGTSPAVDISAHFDPNVFNSFCLSEPPLRAVLPIYSAVEKFHLRQILRNTLGVWARHLDCKIFFIIGVSRNQTLNRKIREEYYREKDILMMNKMDSYRDLNDKAFLMFQWLSIYCSQVQFAIHLIDDAYVNIEMWLGRLESMGDKSNFILGGHMKRPPTARDQLMHTYVTKEEYPEHAFPEYAIGFAYAFPIATCKVLLAAVNTAPYVWIEDVWATGTLRQTAGVPMLPLGRREWKAEADWPIPHLLDGLPPWFMVHPVDQDLMPKLYATVSNSR